MKCVSTETPREDSDLSVRATHCEQRLQLREQKTLTETSPEVTRSADACLSFARVAFKQCVVVKWSGYVQQGTGVGTGVLLLKTDVKHSEVQNLFSLLNEEAKNSNIFDQKDKSKTNVNIRFFKLLRGVVTNSDCAVHRRVSTLARCPGRMGSFTRTFLESHQTP